MRRTAFLTFGCLLLLLLAAPFSHAAEEPAPKRTNLPPLMERYILDELKSMRTDFERLRSDTRIDISEKEVRLASKAMEYSTNTVTFFFYVFAIVGAGLALLGWRSFSDMRKSIRSIAEQELKRLSKEYETRLTKLETELKEKGTIILDNQHEIEKTQKIHALWLQANQTPDARTKIAIYEQILELDPGDYETMAYKADAALQLGDREWALSLCNRILEEQDDYALAFYFRACAYAGLDNVEEALNDLTKALEHSPGLIEQAVDEEDFESLQDHEDFKNLLSARSTPAE
ncbi:TPR end-of-group domain-containing protein [Terasakiella pusilla]|uniref:TPR end-of-group domain-containing protein n=1 Tax=Terasakiella pusilla TaxID=64973 RepID=UPI003AA7C9F8